MEVTQKLYQADVCPRVFVLDSGGKVHYTNVHLYDAPRTASGLAICIHVVESLHTLTAPPTTPPKPASGSGQNKSGKKPVAQGSHS